MPACQPVHTAIIQPTLTSDRVKSGLFTADWISRGGTVAANSAVRIQASKRSDTPCAMLAPTTALLAFV